MIRQAIVICLALAATPASVAHADAPAAVAKASYSTTSTELGTLLDNPAAKEILNKYIAPMISSSQIDMARSMTLKQLQAYAGEMLTDDTLAKIDADLAKLPSK